MKLIAHISGIFYSKNNNKLTYKKIKKEVDNVAKLISAPNNSLPTYGYSKDLAHPHIEIDKYGRLHYVVIERGNEIERLTSDSVEDILFWIFKNVTFKMAIDFELNNRVDTQDTRRIIFEKQVELLGFINKEWQAKVIEEISMILEEHPFNDNLQTIAELII